LSSSAMTSSRVCFTCRNFDRVLVRVSELAVSRGRSYVGRMRSAINRISISMHGKGGATGCDTANTGNEIVARAQTRS